MQLPETSVDFLFGFDAKKCKVEYRFTIFQQHAKIVIMGGKCTLKIFDGLKHCNRIALIIQRVCLCASIKLHINNRFA